MAFAFLTFLIIGVFIVRISLSTKKIQAKASSWQILKSEPLKHDSTALIEHLAGNLAQIVD